MSNPIDVFIVKTSHYLIGAAALIAGLSWKDTIQEIINQTFVVPQENVRIKILLSIVITVITIMLVFILPNTKKELPQSTQEKIQELEEKHKMEKEIALLKLDVLLLRNKIYK